MENQIDSINFQYKIKSILIYNPFLLSSNKKPTEAEIQDAKLLYYFPHDVIQEEKRNQVGLAEGCYEFWKALEGGNNFSKDDINDKKYSKNRNAKNTKKDMDMIHDENKKDQKNLTINYDLLDLNDQNISETQKSEKNYDSLNKEKLNKIGNTKLDCEIEDFGKLQKGYFQIIYCEDYIHIMKEVEPNFFIVIIINPKITCIKYGKNGDSYINEECFKFEEFIVQDDDCVKIVDHFYKNFRIFYGNISAFMNEDRKFIKKDFSFKMSDFIVSYIILNTHQESFNFLRLGCEGINYSPIDKKKFLSMQFIVNIAKTIDDNIEHCAVFYSGFFIFSTFNLNETNILYDYFFVNGPGSEISIQKLNKFRQFDRSNSDLTYGYLNKNSSNSPYILGPTSLDENKQQDFYLFTPTIYLKDSKYKMLVLAHNSLFLLFLYPIDASIEKSKLQELYTTISVKMEKISISLDKQLAKFSSQPDNQKMIYQNLNNLAVKISNRSGLFDEKTEKGEKNEKNEILLLCFKIKQLLLQKNKNDIFIHFLQILKIQHGWIYVLQGNGRMAFLFFGAGLNLARLEDEKEIVMKNLFGNICF